jgi:hypothetical protein
MPDSIPQGEAALRTPASADAPEQPVLDVRNEPDTHRSRRTERRFTRVEKPELVTHRDSALFVSMGIA